MIFIIWVNWPFNIGTMVEDHHQSQCHVVRAGSLTRTPGCRPSWYQTGRSARRRRPAPSCRRSPRCPDTRPLQCWRSRRSGRTDTLRPRPFPPPRPSDSSRSRPARLAPTPTPSSAGRGRPSCDLGAKTQQDEMMPFLVNSFYVSLHERIRGRGDNK